MIKRIFAIALLSIMLFWAMPAALAAAEPSPAEKKINEKLDELLPKGVVHEKTSEGLPTGDFKKEIIPQAIKIVLALAGTVSFGVFVYAGVMLIISQGNEEEITKFKNILIWSIIGLIFITTSYAIVSGVMKLSFE
ncbi:hypothetical protein HYW83_04395 [Candidatus Peregrinibacteria bacterium]|nr:hypothetical protein [Candidatus Peregrinibacteria bacterium]